MANPLQLGLVNYTKGAFITVESKIADRFFIIRSGKVILSKEFEIEEEQGGQTLNPGDFFGVVSTMSTHSHIDNARALTDVTLISVRKDQYSMLIERNTPVALKIINVFSTRVRALDQALTRLTFKAAAEIEAPHLFNVAEYYARQNQFNQAYFAYYKYVKHCPTGKNVQVATERMNKIKPYATVAHLDVENSTEFVRQYPKDTMIFSEGESGPELYIIQKGSVRITKIVDDAEVMLAILKPGDIFGEMALLEDKPRSASAIAHEDTILLAVNRGNFKGMVVDQPKIISRLTILLAERIWSLYKQLANTMLQDPVGRLYDALKIELEKERIDLEENISFTFGFGPKELLTMVGLSAEDGNAAIQTMFGNSKVKIVNNRIHVTDIRELQKQSEYFLKMAKLNKSRKAGSIRNR